jgi:hypothetical protein
LLAAYVRPFGHPDGVIPERIQLFAPFETNATGWERLPRVDRYSGKIFRITTTGPTGGSGCARVQTHCDVLAEFRYHPEAKSADAQGRPYDRRTVGLFRWRRVQTRPELVTYVAKESNKLEAVRDGIEHDLDAVYAAYHDPRRDPRTVVVPILQRANLP